MRHFRIYPDNGPYYFEVHVWWRKETMLRGVNIDIGRPCGRLQLRFAAICLGYEVQQLRNGQWKKSRTLGALHFYRGCFRVGVITHECLHAMRRYMDARKKARLRDSIKMQGRNVHHREEIEAWTIGNLARQVVLGYQRRKPFRPSRGKPPFKQLAPICHKARVGGRNATRAST